MGRTVDSPCGRASRSSAPAGGPDGLSLLQQATRFGLAGIGQCGNAPEPLPESRRARRGHAAERGAKTEERLVVGRQQLCRRQGLAEPQLSRIGTNLFAQLVAGARVRFVRERVLVEQTGELGARARLAITFFKSLFPLSTWL